MSLSMLDEMRTLYPEGEKPRWQYYDSKETEQKIDIIFDNPKAFIENYYHYGSKEDLISPTILMKTKTERLRHTLSAFFLGIYFNEKIPSINRAIGKVIETDLANKFYMRTGMFLKDPFLYTWFMTCLYHDFGYIYERDSLNSEDDYIKEGLRYTPALIDIFCFRKNNLPAIEDSFAPKEYYPHIEDYARVSYEKGAEFRRNNCHDHGIYGGLLLYMKMEELLAKKKLEHYGDKGNLAGSCFKYENLLWGDEMNNRFVAMASWAIIAHNIWTQPEKYRSLFRKYSLEFLVEPRVPLISLQKHPLLYLLCLVDTIEPIKVGNDWRILEQVEISCDKDATITIHNHPNGKLDLSFLGCEEIPLTGIKGSLIGEDCYTYVIK